MSTLYSKILLWFLAIAILPLAITAFFTYQYARTAVQSEIQNFLDEYANKQTRLIDTFVQEQIKNAQVFSKLPILKTVFPELEEAFLKGGADSPPDGSQAMDSSVHFDYRREFLFFAQEIVKTYGYKNFNRF